MERRERDGMFGGSELTKKRNDYLSWAECHVTSIAIQCLPFDIELSRQRSVCLEEIMRRQAETLRMTDVVRRMNTDLLECHIYRLNSLNNSINHASAHFLFHP